MQVSAKYEIWHYVLPDGRDPFQQRLDAFRDARSYAAILRLVDRLASGNFGDHRFCRNGVWELRVDTGRGYRIYYTVAEKTLVILLCGGGKGTQNVDIKRAVGFLRTIKQGPG